MQDLQLLDTDSDYNNIKGLLDFRKLFTLKISIFNGKGLEILEGCSILNQEDIDKIYNWVFNEEHKKYKENFYRLDLTDQILFFKKHIKKDGLYLIGHSVDQTILNRLLLLELRQQYLTEQLR